MDMAENCLDGVNVDDAITDVDQIVWDCCSDPEDPENTNDNPESTNENPETTIPPKGENTHL